MPKPSAKSTLYRLIEAGQAAHKALLVPLLERGLEPGDEAVLFALADEGLAQQALHDQLGGEQMVLARRIERLAARDVVAEVDGRLVLTERGARLRDALALHWSSLEDAIRDELGDTRRDRLGKMLKRLADRLGG